MLIDLNTLRPQNETYEHFFLKQVGRAYLFEQGIRCIATEISIHGYDPTPFGKQKAIIDVLGIDQRFREDSTARRIQKKIEEKALEYGQEYGVTIERKWNLKQGWNPPHSTKKEDLLIFETIRSRCYEQACTSLGYPKDFYQRIALYHKVSQMRGMEIKVSHSDFKNGFSMVPDYLYILAPKNIISVEELPKKAGLLEFDFERYKDEKDWKKCLSVKKRPKKEYDSIFYKENKKDIKHFDRSRYEETIEKLLFQIAQQNTEEHIFWNPHLKNLNDSYLEDHWDFTFQLKIGEKTRFGLVCDRRFGVRPKGENEKNYPYYGRRQTQFYRMVEEGKGMTRWISIEEIEKEPKGEK